MEKFRLFSVRMSGMGFDAAPVGTLQGPARQSLRFFTGEIRVPTAHDRSSDRSTIKVMRFFFIEKNG
ncbi:hypothetical protein ALP98_101376 [Pseudomonas viridiflava]|uniref:Uncharacterized protein n=3 Tax=Pseudomonas syringae group TaxID=136849 RepID=A0A3M4IMH7_PSEVI|nr:hypothetical protein ALQ30_101023 [Pseudomonas syringae pv. persicae]RMQ06059.1 hypothetical protein ALQ09_100927 [Pseudomonas viridiflava]RMQ78773.1 hypothetical protein ALP98_101376 [Pseudomonas viridiflava]RMR52406.1 hypothetical protein ALP83_100842 [Pseudomonas syringae pv. actinidiae]